MSNNEEVIIIGAGPCGLATALALKKYGMNPLIIDKGNIVQAIYEFPTHQTFFSTSNKLEIGNIPFVSPNPKPVRKEALAYYREVASRNNLRIQSYEKVVDVQSINGNLHITTERNNHTKEYQANYLVFATGYYEQPQWMHVPGEDLSKVSHYFKEAHPYYGTNVAVIGGKNSAIDAALELYHAGANVTVLYRGDAYSESIKPWILPEFDSLVQKGEIELVFEAHVKNIKDDRVVYEKNGASYSIKNDFVFAMTGYKPNITLLKKCGIEVDKTTGRPVRNEETFETNIPHVYVAGVIISGFNGNETFIENGRYHGEHIAKSIEVQGRKK